MYCKEFYLNITRVNLIRNCKIVHCSCHCIFVYLLISFNKCFTEFNRCDLKKMQRNMNFYAN